MTAQALGGEALEKEKLWNNYFDSKVDMILSRTKKRGKSKGDEENIM